MAVTSLVPKLEIIENRTKAAIKSLALIYTSAMFYNKVYATSPVIKEVADANKGELTKVLPRIFNIVLDDVLFFDDSSQLGFDGEKVQEIVNYNRAFDYSTITTIYGDMNKLAADAAAEKDKNLRDDLINQYNEKVKEFNEATSGLFKKSAMKNLFQAAFPPAIISGMNGVVPFFTALNLSSSDIDSIQKILDFDDQAIDDAILYLEQNVADAHISSISSISEHTTDKLFIPNVGIIKAIVDQYRGYVAQKAIKPITL